MTLEPTHERAIKRLFDLTAPPTLRRFLAYQRAADGV
jgi:hypothetical protein